MQRWLSFAIAAAALGLVPRVAAAQQPVDRNVQQTRQRGQDRDVGRILAPFPFRDGLGADLEGVGDVSLLEAAFLAPLADS